MFSVRQPLCYMLSSPGEAHGTTALSTPLFHPSQSWLVKLPLDIEVCGFPAVKAGCSSFTLMPLAAQSCVLGFAGLLDRKPRKEWPGRAVEAAAIGMGEGRSDSQTAGTS